MSQGEALGVVNVEATALSLVRLGKTGAGELTGVGKPEQCGPSQRRPGVVESRWQGMQGKADDASAFERPIQANISLNVNPNERLPKRVVRSNLKAGEDATSVNRSRSIVG